MLPSPCQEVTFGRQGPHQESQGQGVGGKYEGKVSQKKIP